jgi:hypothetical protein
MRSFLTLLFYRPAALETTTLFDCTRGAGLGLSHQRQVARMPRLLRRIISWISQNGRLPQCMLVLALPGK